MHLTDGTTNSVLPSTSRAVGASIWGEHVFKAFSHAKHVVKPQDGAFAHFKVFDASASAGCTIYFADGQVDVRLRYPGVAPTLAQAGILRKTPPNSALVGLPVAYFDSVFAEKCGTDADCEPIQLGSSDADVGFRLSAAGVRGGAVVAVWLGFGRIVALHYHCSNLYQIHEYIPYLYF